MCRQWYEVCHGFKIAAHASVIRIREDLDTCQLVLIPEGTVGTHHREDVPLISATCRLTHVELLTVVRVSRKAGRALRQVVAQGTFFYKEFVRYTADNSVARNLIH